MILQIFDWLDFMEKHYTHEGIVVGAFYDSHGYGTRWLKFAYVTDQLKGPSPVLLRCHCSLWSA